MLFWVRKKGSTYCHKIALLFSVQPGFFPFLHLTCVVRFAIFLLFSRLVLTFMLCNVLFLSCRLFNGCLLSTFPLFCLLLWSCILVASRFWVSVFFCSALIFSLLSLCLLLFCSLLFSSLPFCSVPFLSLLFFFSFVLLSSFFFYVL